MSLNTKIALDKITVNLAVKARHDPTAKERLDKISDFRDLYKTDPDKLPRLTVYRKDNTDPLEYTLVDGDARLQALIQNKETEVPVTVEDGGDAEALVAASCSNHNHGERRTREDKRAQVKMLLDSPEWAGKTDRVVAEAAQVSHHLVGDIRTELEYANKGKEKPEGRVGKDKRVYHPKPRKKKESKLFDFIAAEQRLGAVTRDVDQVANTFDLKRDPLYKGLVRTLRDFGLAFRKFRDKAIKQKGEAK